MINYSNYVRLYGTRMGSSVCLRDTRVRAIDEDDESSSIYTGLFVYGRSSSHARHGGVIVTESVGL